MDEAQPESAHYLNGDPANLPAAAEVALAWLEWFRDTHTFDLFEWRPDRHDREGKFYRMREQDRNECSRRLGSSISHLHRLLFPHLPAVHEEREQRRFSDAVAVLYSGPEWKWVESEDLEQGL